MDYVFLSTLCALTGTILMLILYIYLYYLYREPCMRAWIVGWLIHFTRICIFESGLISVKDSYIGCFTYQVLAIACGTMLLYSAHLVINKQLNPKWILSAMLAILISSLVNILHLSLFWRLLPSLWLGGIMLVYIGRIFMHKLKLRGTGNYITGYAFTGWGLLTLMIPVFWEAPGHPQWLTLFCGIFRLIIASGILLVYFEKSTFELLEKEEYYRALADNSVDVIYRYKVLPFSKVEYISPSIYRIIGYTPDEYYSNPNLYADSVHPEDKWLFNAYMNHPAWCTDAPIEYRVIHKNQSIIYIEQNYFPIFDSTGKLIGRQGILRDVTARNIAKRAEAKNEYLNIAGKMALNVTQCIRTPLIKVSCCLQMFKNKQNYKDYYNIIIEEIDKVNVVLSEYILLQKDLDTNLEKANLNNVVMANLDSLEKFASEHKSKITISLKESPVLYIDKIEISCLLLNLVRNSVEAMPDGGEINLRTSIKDNQIVLSVSDQGKGIPGCILHRLGTPFITTKGQGRGLGLPICYRIATRNFADIKVSTSTQGTTFSILFNSPCLET